MPIAFLKLSIHALDMIEVKYFPMPPSVNKSYTPYRDKYTKKLSIKKNNVLTDYFKEAEGWRYRNLDKSKQISKIIGDWLMKGCFLYFDRYLMVHRNSLYYKNGNMRAWDVSNRIKALDDGLTRILGFDDRYVRSGREEAVMIDDQYEECAFVGILPIREKMIYNPEEFELS